MNDSGKIAPLTMALLGMGWFGTHFFWAFYGGSMQLFLNDFTDSKFNISLVLSLAGIANCIVPPVVGYISDRTHTRFGRRKPYVLGGMLGVFLCVASLPHMLTIKAVAVVSAALYVLMSLAETPLVSLLPDITPPRQRSTVSGVVHLLGSFGLIAFFLIGSRIWDEHRAAVFYMVAFVSFGAVLIPLFCIKEPVVSPNEVAAKTNPLEYLKGVAKETNVMKFFAAQFSWWLGFYMVSSFLTLFVVEELNVSEGDSLLVPMALTIVSTIFVLPLGIMGDRFGRKALLLIMVAFWAVAGLFIGFSQSLAHAIITVGVTGIPFAGVLAIAYAYLLDLIPAERTAEFVGFSFISLSAPMIFGPMLAGTLIDTLGYRWVYPGAAVFMFLGFIFLRMTEPRRSTTEESY